MTRRYCPRLPAIEPAISCAEGGLAIDALRRLIGLGKAATDTAELGTSSPVQVEPAPLDAAAMDEPAELPVEEPEGIPCPSCGYVITPAPAHNRRCPACREPIVVRRVQGRTVYLTEAAVEVFESERRRDAEEAANDERRRSWLKLAEALGAPPARLEKAATAPPTAATVTESRRLYMAAAESAARAARTDKRWLELSRLRREQAAALYADAGSPVPPPEDIVELHREGMLAVLRSFGPTAKVAELVGAGCCRVCRADDEGLFKVADELRTPRLPHEGCSKGICACDWWVDPVNPTRASTRRRRSKRG